MEDENQNRTKLQIYKCDQCGSQLKSIYTLKRHKTDVHGGLLYKSRHKDIIDFVSTVESLNFYSDETICNRCDASFRDSHDLRRHFLQVHEGVQVISKKRFKLCKEQLGNVPTGNTLMIQNDKVIGSVQKDLGTKNSCGKDKTSAPCKWEFMCDLCNTGCGTFRNLTLHIHNHIKKKGSLNQKHECTKCSIVFRDRNSLMQHRLVDHKQPKIKSETKAISQSSSIPKDQSELNLPQEDDEACGSKNDYSYECDINIDMSEKTQLLNQKSLNKSKRKKTRDYICGECGITLSSDYSLRQHKAEVHQSIKYCARADNANITHFASTMASVTISSNEAGIQTSDGSKRAYCNKCGSHYRDLHDLKRHILEVHDGIKMISKKTFRFLKEQGGGTVKGNILILESGKAVGSVTKDPDSNYSCDGCTIETGSSAEMLQHHIEKHSNVDNVNCGFKARYVYPNKHDKNRGNDYPLKLYTVKTTDANDSHETVKQREDSVSIFPNKIKKRIKEKKISDKTCLNVSEEDISLEKQSKKSITQSTDDELKDQSASNPSHQEDLTCDLKNEFSDKSDSIRNKISDDCNSIKNDISDEFDLIKNDISDERISINDDFSDDCDSIKDDISVESDSTIDDLEKDRSNKTPFKKKAVSKSISKKMRTHTCDICGVNLSCDYNLRQHKTEVHRGIKYRARADDINLTHFVSTLNKASNKSMIEACKGPTRANCDVCSGSFRDVYALKKHILEVHDGIKVVSRKTYNRLEEQLGGMVKGNVLIVEFGKTVGSVTRETYSVFSCVECTFKAGSSTEMIQHHIEVHSKYRNVAGEVEDRYVNPKSYGKNIDIAFPLKQHTVKTEDQGDSLCEGVKQEKDFTSSNSNNEKKQTLADDNDHIMVRKNIIVEHKSTTLQECVETKRNEAETMVKGEPHLQNEMDMKPINKKSGAINCEQCGIKLASIYSLEHHRNIVHKSKLQHFTTKSGKSISRSDKLNQTVLELQDNISKAFESENIAIKTDKMLPAENEEETKNVIHLQFNCEYCGVSFLRKAEILRHLLQVHQGIKCITINKRKLGANSKVGLTNSQSLISKPNISKSRFSCDKCDIKFKNEVLFRRHLFTIHRRQPRDSVAKSMENKHITRVAKTRQRPTHLACSKCGIKIETLSSIKKHYNEAHIKEAAKHICYRSKVNSARAYRKSSFYSCSSCNTTFQTVNERRNHVRRKICTVGNKITGKQYFKTRTSVKSQMETLKESDIIGESGAKMDKCRYCQKNLSCKRQLKKHENLHVGKVGLRCFACKKLFISRKYLILHMKSHIQETRLECKTCHKIFKSWKFYLKHLKSQQCKADGYMCEICSKTFKFQSGLTNHKLVHAKVKPEFICGICAKSFTRRQCLLNHELVHTDEKPFKCDYCNATLKNKSRLNNHVLMRHTQMDRKHACDKCPMAFRFVCHLRKHQRRIHLREKVHCCKVCDKRFATKTGLIHHLRIHTNERPERCEICGKCFRMKSHLKAHIRMHKGEKLWGCEKCGVRYTDKRSYNRHIERCTSE